MSIHPSAIADTYPVRIAQPSRNSGWRGVGAELCCHCPIFRKVEHG